MKLIDDFMDKKAQDSLKKENEQMVKKARLSELEAKHKEKKSMILHPVKTVSERKEMKNLKEEIASYENEKKRRNSILILGAMIIIGFILLTFIGTRHNSSDNNSSVDETTVAMTSIEAESENTDQTSTTASPVVKSEEPSNIAASTEESNVSETLVSEGSETTESQETVEVIEDNEEIDNTNEIKLVSSDLKIGCSVDYAHVNHDSIYLGNDEGVTFTIEIDNENVEVEDLLLMIN